VFAPRARNRGDSGRLTIGVHCSFAAGNLHATLADYQRRFPKIIYHLVDGSISNLISNLTQSQINITFVTEEKPRWQDRVLPFAGVT
jgi:hypothetical protein